MVYSMHRKRLWRLHVKRFGTEYRWLLHIQDEPVFSPNNGTILGVSAGGIRKMLADAARAVDERDGPPLGPVPKPRLIRM